jgi:hypothetical protein
MAALFLLLFPDWRPGGQRFIFRERDGDTFRHQPGFVRPPPGNEILEDFTLRRDENGFREPARRADFYPIIALGDSFTEGGPLPWPDVLAEALDTPVQNLGWRGFGPLQEAEVMRQYGGPGHDWVLLAYFEGNDLSNIRTAYEHLQTTGALNISRQLDPGLTQNPPALVTQPDGNYLYPLQHQGGGGTYELAYISDYLWWLNGEAGVYQDSRNLALFGQALADIRAAAGEACLAVIYIPTKERIYFPYADPAGNRRYVLENGLTLGLDREGWLSFGEGGPGPVLWDEVASRLDNQRAAIESRTLAADWHFIDLTPAFLTAAETDLPLYYTYDSHWNQGGHALAGRTVADYLSAVEGCPSDD